MLKPIEEIMDELKLEMEKKAGRLLTEEEFLAAYDRERSRMTTLGDIPKRYEKVTVADIPKEVLKVLPLVAEEKNGLYLWGGVGSGKTHTLYAIKKLYAERLKFVRIANMTELLAEIKRSFDDKEETIDILDVKYNAFDDIGAEKESDWVGEQVYRLVNNAYENKKIIIFTSNLPLNELAQRFGMQGDRIASRIAEMCHVIELKGNDRRV